MKTKSIFSLVLVVFFVFGQNLFAIEGAQELDIPEAYDEIIVSPQGTESGSNTFYGLWAGYANTTGDLNSFFGAGAGRNNTTGSDNSFFGYTAGYANTTGDLNSFFGYGAGYGNATGASNSFFGYSAGYYNTTGRYNSFFGCTAGLKNTTAYSNSFFGYESGFSNTTGGANSFFGYTAGYSNTTGEFNSFYGNDSGYSNITGTRNTFIGVEAGHNNEAGGRNTFTGYQAGYNNRGNWNTFNGSGAGHGNVTGYWNTYLGFQAGYINQGSYNVFLGAKAGYNERSSSHKLFIDSTDTATPLIYGEFDNRFLRINGNFTATATSVSSDKRWKKEIEPIESPLKKVSEIRGVRYRWKVDEFPGRGLTDGRQIGLIAQEVERVMPELVSEDKDGYKTVSYSKLTAVLIEAVKEIKAENEKQMIENEALRAENLNLKKDIEKIKSILGI